MKILVTGGAGFIGSSLIEELLRRRHRVICVDNFNDYYNPRFKEENIEKLKNKRLKVINVNIEDRKKLFTVLKRDHFQKIVHLAAKAGVRNSLAHPDLYIKTNILGTLNILELAREKKVKDVVIAGSSSVYGNDTFVPSSEEEASVKPLNPYAMTKRSTELLSYTYHQLYGLNITILRYFTVYGPKGRPDMAPYIFTEAILKGKEITINGTGSAKRDFTNIKDVVTGTLAAVRKSFPYEIINLGSSNPVSINKFLELLEKITGKKAKIKYKKALSGESKNTYSDSSKAETLFAFTPKVKLEDGLTEFVDWFRKNRLNSLAGKAPAFKSLIKKQGKLVKNNKRKRKKNISQNRVRRKKNSKKNRK